MRIGYVRVSKEEQNEALQMDALKNMAVIRSFTKRFRAFLNQDQNLKK